jgi:hypothetical protein
MLRKLVPLAVLLGSLATPALATEWLYCGTGDIQIGLLLGFADTISAVAATLDVGDKHWATMDVYGEGTAISIGKAQIDDETFVVDITDIEGVQPVAALRIFTTTYGTEAPVFGGTLRIEGEGAWAVTCDGY